MSFELIDEHKKLLRTAINNEGISDYEMTISSGSSKGDNYLGIILSITITDKKSSKKLNFILKTAHKNPDFRQQAAVAEAYTRELFVYNTVFPELKRFQLKYGPEIFYHHPKHYGSCDLDTSEAILMDDIKLKGYKLFDRTKIMDSAHVSAVLKTYAKLHGVSLGMKILDNENFKKLSSKLHDVYDGMDPEVFNLPEVFERGYKVITDIDAKNALKNFGSNVIEYFDELKLKNNKYWVITHGDCWCNNLLFSYGDELNPNNPTDVCLIDFQMTKYDSIMTDLAFFFYLAASKPMFYEYEKYLKIYHQSLSLTLKNFGLDSNIVCPFEVLLEDWKIYSKVGLLMGLMSVNLLLSDESEVLDLDKLASEGKINFFSDCTTAIKKSDVFAERINDIVTFQFEKGFL